MIYNKAEDEDDEERQFERERLWRDADEDEQRTVADQQTSLLDDDIIGS